MADTPRPWQIVTSLEAALSDVRVASGYRTDIGAHIWLNPAQRSESDIGISIGTESIVRTSASERPSKRGRALNLVLESAIAVGLDDAHQIAHDVAEDLEVALASYVAQQLAAASVEQTLPIEIGDIQIMESPEGLPVIAVQARVIARYWR